MVIEQDEFLAGGAVALTPDVAAACAAEWRTVGVAGDWWTGAERVAIAAEARRARDCPTCAQRKAALSPGLGTDGHDARGALDAVVVDAIHRITTDPGRLSKTWYERVLASGLQPGAYVELVGVIFTLTLVDTFAAAIDATEPVLPSPQRGAPPRVAPEAARPGGARVPIVPPDGWSGPLAQMYQSAPPGSPVANIILALSLVPREQLGLVMLMRHTYRHPVPEITEPQIQLIASTVSAYNDCFY
jgi:hypothetical protein